MTDDPPLSPGEGVSGVMPSRSTDSERKKAASVSEHPSRAVQRDEPKRLKALDKHVTRATKTREQEASLSPSPTRSRSPHRSSRAAPSHRSLVATSRYEREISLSPHLSSGDPEVFQDDPFACVALPLGRIRRDLL